MHEDMQRSWGKPARDARKINATLSPPDDAIEPSNTLATRYNASCDASQSRRIITYSKQFNIVLGVLPVVTAGIILAMQSNLVISLGMVGALSIVRFRTAVKEPKDLLFLFWSIGIGIILGARNYELALLISLVVTILLFLLELIGVQHKELTGQIVQLYLTVHSRT